MQLLFYVMLALGFGGTTGLAYLLAKLVIDKLRGVLGRRAARVDRATRPASVADPVALVNTQPTEPSDGRRRARRRPWPTGTRSPGQPAEAR